jgi:hypothetical protein
VTAPLTPPEPSHPAQQELPPYPGATAYPAKADAPSGEPISRELVRGVLVAVLVAVCGVALGLLWLWLSPRVPMVSDGQAVYLKDTEGEEAIGGDGTFVLIALVLGALTAAAVFWRFRKGGVAVVLGLAAGGALASVIGWRLGVALGPTTDIVAHAKQVGPKVVFDGPLDLRAKSAIVVWPAAAMVVHLALTYAFGSKDEIPRTEVPPADFPWAKAPAQEAPHSGLPRAEAPPTGFPPAGAAHPDTSHPDAPRAEPPRDDPPRDEPPRSGPPGE